MEKKPSRMIDHNGRKIRTIILVGNNKKKVPTSIQRAESIFQVVMLLQTDKLQHTHAQFDVWRLVW